LRLIADSYAQQVAHPDSFMAHTTVCYEQQVEQPLIIVDLTKNPKGWLGFVVDFSIQCEEC
jgi:hypothetical protein